MKGSSRPNMILISIDTLRADRLSCYGYSRLTSPHIDRLAQEGVLFTDFFSPHIPTFPGHTTMFTGKDIYETEITGQSHRPELSPHIKTVAELLQAEGYFTAAADSLGRWFARGFEVYESYSWPHEKGQPLRKGEAVNRVALSILEQCAQQSKPFFLFVHYWDPHTPYLPPPPFDRLFYGGDETDPNNRSMDPVLNFPPFMWYFREWMGHVTDIQFPCAQYDGEIAYVDACIGQLVNRLEELHLSDSTVLILTSDHGEELIEHEMWFDHHGLYDTNLHVPLIMRGPGILPQGKRIAGMTRMHDLPVTLLDLAGLLPLAKEHKMQGQSLLLLLLDPSSVSRGTCERIHITENTWMKKRGWRTLEWKFIQSLEHPDIHGRPPQELYHLTTDPGEQKNLAEERPDLVAEFSALLEEHVSRRLAETGREGADPLLTQPIPLRQIGNIQQAHPADEKRQKK